MLKFRVVQNSLTDETCQETNAKIFAERLTEQEATYVRDNLIHAGEENVHIEEYDYISPEHRGLGRDPDLH